jgi:probable HAF family extracellular repeat protein
VDVQTIVNEALGLDLPVNDLNGDGWVNVVDVQIDLNAALNLGCSSSNQALTAAKVPSTARLVSQSTMTGASLAAPRPASVTDLGTLGGNSAIAYGMNDRGQVVGASEIGKIGTPESACPQCPIKHAFLWERGQMTDLDGANARDSVAYSINYAGQIAGVYSDHDRETTGFLYAAGAVTELSKIPHGTVSAINFAGQIIGGLLPDNSSSLQAFLWNAGTVTNLGTLGGTGSQARAINDSGQIAGSANLDGNSATHAFLYSGAGLTDLGTLGGKDSTAFGINSVGQVVGSSQTAGSGPSHAFVYSGEAMTDLGTLGGLDSQADGINNSGLIVGWSRIPSGEQPGDGSIGCLVGRGDCYRRSGTTGGEWQ